MKIRRKLLALFTAISMPLSMTVCMGHTAQAAEEVVTQGNTYHGFKLVSQKKLTDIDSTALIFQHVKSGARLMYLKNDDVNKFFSIAFRTPVNDDTGVNHIIEHSVLCGSKKYPVKSALTQLEKKSMSTFLNAFTTADYTSYPVGSRNNKDFNNLMHVYLDAVFNPNMVTNPKIFSQEGWRYELDKKDGELKENGVVYNEMSGDAASASTRINEDVNKTLFPDTIYKYNSGGDPDKIPTLTREKLIETYKKYYKPSNCYIYLYGKIDMDSTLKYIDDEYLSKYKYEKVDSGIKEQKPMDKSSVIVDSYSVSKDEDSKDKTYISYNYSLPDILDKESTLGFPMLSYLLTGSENAPLEKALKDIGVSELSSSSYNNSGLQAYFSVLVPNTEEKEKDKIRETITKVLTKVSKEGFAKANIDALLNTYELTKRFSKFSDPSAGLNYFSTAMQSWLYDGDPTMYLQTEDTLNKIKSQINKGYFQNLIKKYILQNKNTSIVIVKPEKGLSDKKSLELKSKLAEMKKGLSDKETEDLVKNTKELKQWQTEPDSKEALATIPGLKKEDMEIDIEDIPTQAKDIDGVKVLQHSLYTNKLSNINMYFDASGVPQEKLQYYSLYTHLLGMVDTEKHSYKELEDEKNMYAPAMLFVNSPVYDARNTQNSIPKNYLSVSMIGLEENTGKLMDLCDEIANFSKFSDKERIKAKIKELKETYDLLLKNSGELVGSMRMEEYLNDYGSINDSCSGIGYYKFISDLYNNFDKKWNEIKTNLEDMHKYVFNKNKMVVGYTGGTEGYNSLIKSLPGFDGHLSAEKLEVQNYKVQRVKDKNEGIKTQEKVLYVFKGGNLTAAGYKYEPKMLVLQNILSSGYLWDKVRVDGGAYGVDVSISNTGEVVFSSSQDPNLKKTLKAFDDVVDYLKNFKATDEEMSNYIISTVRSTTTKVMDPVTKGAMADSMYLTNQTMDEVRNEIKDILNTTAEDIVKYGEILKKVLEENYFCVAGDESKIEENKDIFESVKKLNDFIK